MTSKVQVIREYFNTPEKPITSAELMDLAKNDRKGYDELAILCAKALNVTLDN
jgi:hypothetical protein